jgi:ABC-type multidrug transport system ATPase subunit
VDLSFEVHRGEIFGLLGPNGAGKTTLILQLLGLLEPTSGNIWIEGIDVKKTPDKIKMLASFLPQSGTPKRFTPVEQALFFAGRLRDQSVDDARVQARELIEELEMGEYAARPMNRLSGGMARMVNFALALMGHPRVIVLDEPTNELDPHNRRIIWQKIAQLNYDSGVTCVLVTHNVFEAERVIQRVAVLHGGQIVALGTPGELKMKNGGKIRLEFNFKEGIDYHPSELDQLREFGVIEKTRSRHYRLYLPQSKVALATEMMVNQIGLDRLDDFRLSPPSLEDVYLDLEPPAPASREYRLPARPPKLEPPTSQLKE